MIINGEYGKVLVLDCGFDLTGQTGLALAIDRPDGTTVSRTQASGLAVGSVDLTLSGVTYTANQYITYTLQDGDLPDSGFYYQQITVTFPTKTLKSPRARFEVRL